VLVGAVDEEETVPQRRGNGGFGPVELLGHAVCFL